MPTRSAIGAVNFSYVARNSKAGKAAIAALDAFGKQKSSEVQGKAAELQKQEVELQKQSGSMSPRAVADLQRAFEKSRLEFDRFQQDAQAELEAMQNKFDADFRVKLAPILEEISKEKGLALGVRHRSGRDHLVESRRGYLGRSA